MRKYTKEILISILQKYYKENGLIPNCRIIRELKISDRTFKQFFGSWNNALLEAGFTIKWVPPITVICLHCGKEFKKNVGDIKKYPNNFCSQSHAASYNNTHKTKGNRRSKLEIWLEKELTDLYPQLNIVYCDKETINSELDIYIPSLHLAFELNGIFHYEPIYGLKKLNQIQNNDNRKFAACLEKNISLCIIDSSKQERFTEKSSKQFLDIISNIINQILSPQDEI